MCTDAMFRAGGWLGGVETETALQMSFSGVGVPDRDLLDYQNANSQFLVVQATGLATASL